MLNKKIMILAMITAYCSFVPCVGMEIRSKYQSLLECQRDKSPQLYLNLKDQEVVMNLVAGSELREGFKIILKEAERTGLIKQCEKFLTGDSVVTLDSFVSPLHLQEIAYLQNHNGKGNPFEVSDTAAFFIKLGTFVSPASKKTVIITPYSFFNSLIEACEKLYNRGEFVSNTKFQESYKLISKNLSTALEMCEAQEKAGTRQDLLRETFKNLTKKVEAIINDGPHFVALADRIEQLIEVFSYMESKVSSPASMKITIGTSNK